MPMRKGVSVRARRLSIAEPYASMSRVALSSHENRRDCFNPSSTHVRASAGSLSSRSIAAVSPATSSGSTISPARPTTSGSARDGPTTGTPIVIASRAGRPNPSSSEGSTTIAPAGIQSLTLRLDVARDDARAPASGGRASSSSNGWHATRRPARTSGGASAFAQKPGIGAEQRADVLARLERAHEEDGRGAPPAGARDPRPVSTGARHWEQIVTRSAATPSLERISSRGVVARP